MRMHTLWAIALLGFTALVNTAVAQTSQEQAKAKAAEAVQLMDNGDPAKAIALLDEAEKLDPGGWVYKYETAYAQYLQKNYGEAQNILKKLIRRKDANAGMYQLLGNTYDMTGHPEKAVDTYEKGLKSFPEAGNLYLERGVMELDKDNNKALSFFEAGIKAAPEFPSNYYWATRIFLASQEEVWGMIYGEIFLNLERNSKRTNEISKLLYLTYKGEIKFPSDTSATVSFSKNNTINIVLNKKTKPEDMAQQLMESIKIPYGIGVYEPTLLIAVGNEKIINLAALNRIRSRFVDLYGNGTDSSGLGKGKPVVLFTYQQKIKEAGFMEPYNYWILAEGDEKEFEAWRDDHPEDWKKFIAWFKEHPIDITAENKFYRAKY